ncbi:MAG: sulfotransferase family protein [Steroidobacterales bacterium]
MTALAWSDRVWAAAETRGPCRIAPEDIERGVSLARRPVFICGVHRSGTTLIRDLLDSHPALSVLPAEGTLHSNRWSRIVGPTDASLRAVACEWVRRLANHSNQPPFWLLGRSSSVDSPYVSFARALMAWWFIVERALGRDTRSWTLVAVALAYAYCNAGGRIAPAALRWVEKTPANERFINRLLAEFPDARIIHVIRDPMAVFNSRKIMELHTSAAFRNVRAVLRDLARTYRVAIACSDANLSDRYLLIRYEQLVNDQRVTISRLAAFLGIQPLPILWRPTIGGVLAGSNSSYESGEVKGRILADDEHMPHRTLTGAEKLLVATVVGRSANRLGYGISAVSGLRATLRRIAYR